MHCCYVPFLTVHIFSIKSQGRRHFIWSVLFWDIGPKEIIDTQIRADLCSGLRTDAIKVVKLWKYFHFAGS